MLNAASATCRARSPTRFRFPFTSAWQKVAYATPSLPKSGGDSGRGSLALVGWIAASAAIGGG